MILAVNRKGRAMSNDFAKGDRVSWNTPQGRTQGTVVQRRTKDFEFSGRHFTASADDAAYIVESEKSGDRAAHKGSALRKLG
jgi:Hypervirulence associated proteins TUDOR domain